MTTKNRQPLYKILNEQRTQGDWQMSADKCDVETADDARLGIFRLFATEADEANAQYTVLAVNNLHHLAEALERIHSLLEQGETVSNMQNIIEEALTRIS